ncbi:DUF2793 domain-containing protein [Ancylobacter polymorphus]|uniref:DUF2793 domain-containing protein n=1 Tax=Ancylobacter polymorphus TaxID=223390 RepID=A0ABU0BHM7_9HYPH|nr:DUF2793 domain-containing protein [Ancylobacter polymorphus]MDQ0305354.1 hypothetical protein [Ancylobacter polymorphus]
MADYYATGAVSVSNGGTTVTGSGVVWSTVQAGDTLELAGQRVTIAAAPVSPYTSLTLAVAWTGTTQSGAPYVIRYDAPARFTAGYLATQVRELVAKAAVIEAARPSYGVVSVGSNTPPGSPVTNDMYVVGTSPTGAWSGQANNLAQWTGSAWQFTAPTGGTTAVSEATNGVYIFSGTAWNLYVAPSSFIATLMDDADADAARTTLGAFAASGVSSFGAMLIDDADAATARATLGAFAASGVSSFGATLIDDADAAAARATLGLTPTTGTSTPTPTAASGTLTTASSSLKYEKVGTRVRLTGTVTVTTAGTGVGELLCTIPFTCGSNAATSGNAREVLITGVGCVVTILGGQSYLRIARYDNATVIADSRTVLFEITYDAAS